MPWSTSGGAAAGSRRARMRSNSWKPRVPSSSNLRYSSSEGSAGRAGVFPGSQLLAQRMSRMPPATRKARTRVQPRSRCSSLISAKSAGSAARGLRPMFRYPTTGCCQRVASPPSRPAWGAGMSLPVPSIIARVEGANTILCAVLGQADVGCYPTGRITRLFAGRRVACLLGRVCREDRTGRDSGDAALVRWRATGASPLHARKRT
jgi:hypothetical protein